MAELRTGIITHAGINLLQDVIAGKSQINYTKVVFCDDENILNMSTEDVRNLTNINPDHKVVGNPVAFDNGTDDNATTGPAQVVIEAVADNKSISKGNGFNPYVEALYASDGTKEILYGFILDDRPGFLFPYDGTTPQALIFKWVLKAGTTDNFNLDTKDEVYATIADLQGMQKTLSESVQQDKNDLKQFESKLAASMSGVETSLKNQIASLQSDVGSNVSQQLSKATNELDEIQPKLKMLEGQTPAAPQLSASMDTVNGTITYSLNQPSKNDAGNVYQYFIYYKNVNDTNYQEVITANNKDTISGLNGKQKYNLYVVAENAAGISDKSNVVTTDVIDSRVFGVTWNRTSDSSMQRTDAAAELPHQTGVNGAENDFDNYSVWKQMHPVYDSYGNKFIRIPKFYIYKNQTGSENNGQLTMKISLAKHVGNGWYLPKCFWDFAQNTELPYVDVGAYVASDNGNGGLESKSGQPQLDNIDLDDFRNRARSLNQGSNQGYQLLDYPVVDVLQVLFTVEFATLNSQSILNDTDSGNQNTGVTDSDNGSTNMSDSGIVNYRGIENLWGWFSLWVDGLTINNGAVYVCDDPNQYQSNVMAYPYHQIGYSTPQTSNWVSSMGFDPSNPDVFLPTDLNAASDGSNYYGDYFDGSSGGPYAAIFGGWDSGAYDGIWLWNLNYSSTTTYSGIGSRLIKKA